MNAATKKRLYDALAGCRAIAQFTAGREFADYARDLQLRSAVERQFEIAGEALGRAADSFPELASRIPDLPRIVGMRNRIIHGYDAVDDELVWDAVQFGVPALIEQITSLLRDTGDDS
jgi:uncharacterized protein with HEPN domain